MQVKNMMDGSNYILILKDLKDLQGCQDTIDDHIKNERITALTLIWQGESKHFAINHQLFDWLYLLPILTVVVSNKLCSGDVFVLFMASDIRLGGSDLVIRFSGDATLDWNLKEQCKLLMGRKAIHNYEHLLSKDVGSKELHALNLINHVLDEDNLINQGMLYVNKLIADKSNYQIKAMVKCFKSYKKLGLSNNRHLLLEQEYIQFCQLITADYSR